jgi:hypothetical protein
VKELIAYAKANPGKLNFGSSGIGAAAHLTCELFKQTTGVDMVHVPFKGTAPAMQAAMANDIQILVDTPLSLVPQARAGKLKALGMFSAKRLPAYPEVPTLAESGGPALESSTWVMFMAPGATPRELVYAGQDRRPRQRSAGRDPGPSEFGRYGVSGIDEEGSESPGIQNVQRHGRYPGRARHHSQRARSPPHLPRRARSDAGRGRGRPVRIGQRVRRVD